MLAMRFTFISLFLALVFTEKAWAEEREPAKECGYEIVASFPHDEEAFTQGLLFEDGYLLESTGEWGSSTIRRVELESGAVVDQHVISDNVFGEGAAVQDDKVYSITWQAGIGYIWSLDTLEEIGRFSYEGEGWGLTSNGYSLIQSNGSSELAFFDPRDMKPVRQLRVTDGAAAVERLNELEWVNGRILANVWQAEKIAIINADSGVVEEWMNLSGLRATSEVREGPDSVLNGIAYDKENDRLFVTGKNWPVLYQIVPGADCGFTTTPD